MKLDNLISYAKEHKLSLDDTLYETPELIYPKGGATEEFGPIERILTAYNIYDAVQRFLQEKLPVIAGSWRDDFMSVDDLNNRVMRDMRHMYSEGIGHVDISSMTERPQLTGSILLLHDWDSLAEGIYWDSLEVYSAFNTICEIKARADLLPYDITTMQGRDYDTLRLYTSTQTIPGIFYGELSLEDENPLFVWVTHTYPFSMSKFYSATVGKYTETDPYGLHVLSEAYNYTQDIGRLGRCCVEGYNSCLEEGRFYNEKDDCYVELREIYNSRTRCGYVIYWEILR